MSVKKITCSVKKFPNVGEMTQPIVVINTNNNTLIDVIEYKEYLKKCYSTIMAESIDITPLNKDERTFVVGALTDNKDDFVIEFVRRSYSKDVFEWIRNKMPVQPTVADRSAHWFKVGSEMRALAPLYGLDPEEMFTLGLLHDIGYVLTGDPEQHNFVGGEHLRDSMDYKYWQEVYWHGYCAPPYKSAALNLLNYVDLRVNAFGEPVTVEERLENIAARYGRDSVKYTMAKALAEKTVLPDPPPLK